MISKDKSDLTDFQRALLLRIREAGSTGLRQNMRANKAVRKLLQRGNITATMEVRPDTLRGHHTLFWHCFAKAAVKHA